MSYAPVIGTSGRRETSCPTTSPPDVIRVVARSKQMFTARAEDVFTVTVNGWDPQQRGRCTRGHERCFRLRPDAAGGRRAACHGGPEPGGTTARQRRNESRGTDHLETSEQHGRAPQELLVRTGRETERVNVGAEPAGSLRANGARPGRTGIPGRVGRTPSGTGRGDAQRSTARGIRDTGGTGRRRAGLEKYCSADDTAIGRDTGRAAHRPRGSTEWIRQRHIALRGPFRLISGRGLAASQCCADLDRVVVGTPIATSLWPGRTNGTSALGRSSPDCRPTGASGSTHPTRRTHCSSKARHRPPGSWPTASSSLR